MQHPFSILFLPSWYPRPADPTHGIFIKRHAEALAIKNRVTVVYARSEEGLDKERWLIKEEGNLKEIILLYPKVNHVIPGLASLKKFNTYSRQFKKAIDMAMEKESFNLMQLYITFPAAIAALKVLAKKSMPLFIAEQWSGYYPEDGNYKGFMTKYFTQKAVAKAKAVLVVSEKLKNSMLSHGLNNHYEIFNNVVDTNLFKPLGEKKSSDSLKILHVSSLVDREKNISGILEVAKELKKRGKKTEWIIAGGHPEQVHFFKEEAKKKGLEQIMTFVGSQTPAELVKRMNVADVFLLFSFFEGMPVVILESLACGLPVISTPVGAVPSMIQEGMGLVLKNQDINACADVLENYQRKNYLPPIQLHQYINEQFGYPSVGDKMTQIYQQYIQA